MQSTDSPPPALPLMLSPDATAAAAEMGRTAAISLRDRVTVLGLLLLLGVGGIGSVVIVARLWHQQTETTLPPLMPSSEPAAAEPVRDRVPIITASPASPAVPVAPPTSPSMQRSSPLASDGQMVRRNQPFATRAKGSTIAVQPIPPGAPPAPSASAPGRPPSSLAIAQTPAVTPPPPRPFPVALIAALLQAPSAAGDRPPVASMPSPRPPAAVPTPSSSVPPSSPNPVAPLPPATIVPPAAREAAPHQSSSSPIPVPPAAVSPAPNPAATPDPPAAPTEPVTASPAVPPDSPPPLAVKPPLQERIPVNQLQITGSTRFALPDLVAIVQNVIAARDPASPGPPSDRQSLSPAELVQASEAITKLYTDRGYINSGAFVPAEVLTGAPPEIRVVEGSLEAINVEVQRPGFLGLGQPLSPRYVRRRLERNIQTPLQIDQLADAIRLLEQDPLIRTITTKLAPGTQLGKSTLNVTVKQAPPLRATFAIDNGRAPSVGTFRQQVSLSQANLLGLGDRLQVGYNRSAGSQSFDVGFALPLNPRNGTLSFTYTNSRGEVIQEPFRDLGIQSRSQNYELALRQPVYQTANELVALSLRGTHYRNEGQFLEAFNNGVAIPFPARGSDIDGKTRITAIRFGQEWLKRSTRDVFSLQSEFNLGVNFLDATQLEDPPDGRFFSWQGRGFWVHSLAPDTLFALKGQLQFANRPLVPVEQISLGGIDTVRGYTTGVLLADNAWFASAEFYLPVLRVPRWQGLLQVVPFIDAARGWNQGFDQPDPSRLLSVGMGLQWKMGDNFRARLDWGVPLINSTAINGQSLRQNLFFSIIYTP